MLVIMAESRPSLDYGKMGLMHMNEIGPQVRRGVTQLQTTSVMMMKISYVKHT